MNLPHESSKPRSAKARRSRRLLVGSALFVVSALSFTRAEAQDVIIEPTRLPALGRSVAATDDTTALVQNPANLAFMPSSELRWSAIFLDDKLNVPWQGNAVAVGLRLPFSLATGLRLDFVNPPSGMGPLLDRNYQWLTWGLALGIGPRTAIGGSLQYSFSKGAFANDLGSYSFGISSRPWQWLGISLNGNDLNAPKNSAGFGVGSSFEAALAVRPLGTRAVEIGLEAKNADVGDERVWIPRATAGVDIGPIGRLRGEFSMADPGDKSERSWLAALGLSIHASDMDGSSEVGGGVVTGNGLGSAGSYNLYTDVAFRGWREPVGITGMAPQRYAIRMRIESTPNSRQHVAWLRQLWSLADEPSVDVVVFEVRTSPAESLGQVQELRDAIFNLRRHGKRTLCHLEDASGDALYLCAATNKILINPSGGVRFSGFRTQHIYLARLLEKLGIKADFIRVAEHKSAPEQFMRTGSTDVSRADKIDLLQQHERQVVEGLAVGRSLSFDQVRERLARGPFMASEAKEAGLVDGYAFDDELQKAASDLAGRPVSLVYDTRARTAPKSFPARRRIALVYVDGDMIDGRSRTVPLVGMRLEGSYTIAETLKAAREDADVAAVVLRIESPGGSSMAADVMWREVKLTADTKPVIVSMGSVAASGGYYIAAPATRIFANPLTITGSIGIFYGKADISQLLNKIGLDVETIKTSERADAESLFRPFSPNERRELEHKVGQFYDLFLSRVAEGRKLSKAAVDQVGQGRVWTGEQAKEHALVDELGGLRQALDYARKLAKLPSDAPIDELPELHTSLLWQLLGIEGLHSQVGFELPLGLQSLATALAPFMVHPSDKPLARIEFATIGPE